ncbi:MAG: hypothetical protein GY834_14110 [Bacteroidetes bacterium]|nr:hypothetical protein [Bacteroidota bacterium]
MSHEIKEIRPVDLARRLRSESNEELKSWVRLVVTLSSTFLSVLIAFKSNYVPNNAEFLIFLSCGLISFVFTIFSGIVILHTGVQTKFDSANHIEANIKQYGENGAAEEIKRRDGTSIARPIYIYAHFVFHLSFALAFAFLVAFVSVNM